MLYVVNLHHPKATSLLYWAVCCQSTGPEATPKPLHSSSILCCMLSTYTTPKPLRSLLYWAVCCQSTGPEATPKPLHSSSILCCMLSTYTTPKPLHIANLQGLKPPQSRYILLLYCAVCCQPTPPQSRYILLLYYAVCCQPTPPQSHYIPSILGCMLPIYRA